MTSQELFEKAQKYIPGGVNSPVRSFSSVGGDPVFISSAEGAVMTSSDGEEYLDFCGSWGPLILGHADPDVVAAVQSAAAEGLSFGTCSPREVEMAERLCSLCDGMERVRMVTSGTEATMTAIRLARGFTGRERVVKFAGCYHGHHDAMLVAAGSGLLTGGTPSSAGVPAGTTAAVSVLPYNDAAAVREFMHSMGGETAAIIVEPVAGNMGLVNPGKEYLQLLRDLCSEHGTVLIFDEVIAGFRQSCGTWGGSLGILADLTCLGKIIGGGMPIGAVGGKAVIMERLAPAGDVYQAGTLSGNPVALAAGLATLNKLKRENPYPRMAELCRTMAERVNFRAAELERPFHIAFLGGAFTPFFCSVPVTTLADAQACDTVAFGRFHGFMLKKGIYLPPSQFETAFFSAVHTDDDAGRLMDALLEWLDSGW